MDCSMPGLPVHHQLLEFNQTPVHWVSDAIQPSHPLLSPSPPAFNLSQHQGLFKWVSSSHPVAKVLEFQFQQGTLKSLLQPHSSKISILPHSAFFIVQISHLHMTTGKTIALTRRTFFGSPPLLYSLQTPILMQSSWATYYIARSFAIQLCVGGWSRLFPKQRKILP